MRVAISGTHCCGKSTLIAEFLLVYPKYNHEPEPYAVMVEEYGEILSAESVDDFYRQLEFMVERLQGYRPGDRVIFERSPVDFAAYMLALDDLGRDRTGTRFVEDCLEIVRNAIQQLDLILFLPLNEKDSFVEEDPVLRTAVNDRLVEIYRNSDLNLFVSERPSIIEAFGPTTQRLRTLESALAK